jgi:two-component system response regulator BaeR
MATGKVLVVEDEIKIAALLEDFLKVDGFVVQQVHDGAEVIDSVKQYAPDCIILDVMLPNKDGFTLCKEIRTFSTVPIIF